MRESKTYSVLEIFYDFVFVNALFGLIYMIQDLIRWPLDQNMVWRFALTMAAVLYIWFSQVTYNNRFLKEGPLDYICHFFDMTVLLILSHGNTVLWKDSWVILSATLGFLCLSLALRYGIQGIRAQTEEVKYLASRHALIFLTQAILLLVATTLPYEWGVALLVVAVLAGWLAPLYFLRDRQVPALDLAHLKNRVSLMFMMYLGGLIVISLGPFLSEESDTLMGLVITACLILHYKIQIDRLPQGGQESATGFIYSHYVLMIGLSYVIVALRGFMSPHVRISHMVDLSYGSLCVYYLGIILLSFKTKPEFKGGFATWKIYLPLLVGWLLSKRTLPMPGVELVRLTVVIALIFAGQVYLLKNPKKEPAPVLEGAPAEGDQVQELEAAEEAPVREVAEEVALEIEPAKSEVTTTEVPSAPTPESLEQADPQAESPASSQD